MYSRRPNIWKIWLGMRMPGASWPPPSVGNLWVLNVFVCVLSNCPLWSSASLLCLINCMQEGCGPDHVIGMLHGHKDRVNCLQWMTWRSGHDQSRYGRSTPLELISGSVDNDVIVWGPSTDSNEVWHVCLFRGLPPCSPLSPPPREVAECKV